MILTITNSNRKLLTRFCNMLICVSIATVLDLNLHITCSLQKELEILFDF